jgi:hypothetical protein
VTKPAVIKLTVATMERMDKRLNPHMPWPLVQPDPMRLPKPTSSPAIIRVGLLAAMLEGGKATISG